MKSSSTNLLAVVACLLWSTAFVGIKIGLAYTTPIRFAGARFFLAGAVLLPFAGGLGTLKTAVVQHPGYIAVVSLLSTVVLYALFYLGLSMGNASTTAIVVGGGPLFIAIMAHWFMPDDKLTGRKSLALGMGFLGISVIATSRFGAETSGHSTFLAILLLVGSNISGGFGNILIAKGRGKIPPRTLTALQMSFGGAVLYLISLFIEPFDTALKPLPYFGALLYLSALSAGAMSIWFTLLSREDTKVSEINFWKFIVPVLGAVLSWTVLADERPDWGQVSGMAAVAAALVVMYFRRRGPSVRQLKASSGAL